MIIRSLRWRLVFAMALIIGATVVAAGVFSSLSVKRAFERFLVAQQSEELRAAEEIFRKAPNIERAVRDVYERLGFRAVVFDDQKRLVARNPSLAAYRIAIRPDGTLVLRRSVGGTVRAMLVKGPARRIEGKGTVYLLPPPGDDPRASQSFRISVDRWLLIGLAGAALLAVIVMLTIMRRIFAPVEALTRGARALASGRLDARVDVRGRDEVAELGRAFNSMAEALERNERARRNMVSDVAHELRTPLTNMRVQIEAAQDRVVEADASFLASIEEDAKTLEQLINDLQQLSLADAGQLRLEARDVSIAALVEHAASGVPLRGLTLARDVPADLHTGLDERRMTQVLRNLLVNATTHAAKAIEVHARAIDGFIEIRVADDGPGIADEHAALVFDRFYRADPSRSRATGGTGLGLSIAKQLVELHGGSIRYERPSFIIQLPS